MTKVLGLRTCNADMTSYNGFQWSETGHVEAPDWDPKPYCGNGLHGLLWGEGYGALLNRDRDAKWMVVEVEKESIVNLQGKVKFPSCDVVFVGNQYDATQYIWNHGGYGRVIVGVALSGGDRSVLTGGDCSTLNAGNYSNLTGGYNSTLTGGYRSVLTGGDCSTLNAGNYS